MAQAALNDGLDPVQYAANYGLDLNAPAGTAIQAYDNSACAFLKQASWFSQDIQAAN